MKKIQLLQIIGDSSLTGAPTSLFNLVKGLDKKKFQITCICPHGPLSDKLKQIEKIKVEPILIKSKWDLNAVRTIRHIIRSSGSNLIVHCHGVRAGWLGRLACFGPKKVAPKVVYTEHLWTVGYKLKNPISHWFQLFSLWFLDLVTTKTIAVSQAVAYFLIKKGITREEKLNVIYNGIEPPEGKSERKKIKKMTKKVIGFVGSLVKRKGIEYLIKAVSEISKLRIKLIIVGDGPERKNLENLSKNLKINKIVEFRGFVKDINEQYREFDVYVQPSLDESFGIATLEAMNFGLPIIASGIGGLPELLNLNPAKISKKPFQVTDCGILVPPKNGKVLSEAILKILKDEKLAKKIGEGAKKRAKEFSADKMVRETTKLYLSLVE